MSWGTFLVCHSFLFVSNLLKNNSDVIYDRVPWVLVDHLDIQEHQEWRYRQFVFSDIYDTFSISPKPFLFPYCYLMTFLSTFFSSQRDNLALLESGVQKALKDKEERLVILVDLDQLASGWISILINKSFWQTTSQTACNEWVSVHFFANWMWSKTSSLKGPMGTDGGTGTKGPVVCTVFICQCVFVC